MFVLCLRILQSALAFVNTLMLQDILGESEWAGLLTPADRRGLTPLFWSHVRPYGEVNLDMDTRLNLTAATVPGPRPADGKAVRSTVEKTRTCAGTARRSGRASVARHRRTAALGLLETCA
ncbi:Tn3 family transposase [Streptomyces carpaticus]|uniref:Tn3 family transposase n=1 Tax=Streptomyces carpaticus TaxID=285558 RepID=A0ABV4ZT38_9ACTN